MGGIGEEQEQVQGKVELCCRLANSLSQPHRELWSKNVAGELLRSKLKGPGPYTLASRTWAVPRRV